MTVNKDMVIKIVGIGLSLAGTVVSGIASDREAKKLVEKLVNEQLKKQGSPTWTLLFFVGSSKARSTHKVDKRKERSTK